MTNTDSFDKVLHEWYRGIQMDVKAQQEQRNIDALINALKLRGHTVAFDKTYFYLYVDTDTDHKLTITTESAREMETETLLKWVEERTKR
jgi:hypothetical protein